MKEIATKRLRITPFSEHYLTERYVGWLNDAELMKYSEQRHRDHTLDSCREYIRSFEGTSHCFWAIEDVVGELGHIGNINAYIDKSNSVADVGILIGCSRASGNGYGVEAWLGVSDHLFREQHIRKITAGTLAVNGPMIRLALRAKMIEDGIRRRHYLCEGAEVDMLYFALFKESWKATLDAN